MNSKEDTFYSVLDATLSMLDPQEHLTIELRGEESHFVRFNHARVRQNGLVKDGNLKLTLTKDQRELSITFPFTGDKDIDIPSGISYLERLRAGVDKVPPNPYAVAPKGGDSSRAVYRGKLLDPDRVVGEILAPVQDLDFVGFYAGGTVIRASASSRGDRHWFETESFFLDYSIYQKEQAVKGIYSDREWNQSLYLDKIKQERHNLNLLAKTPYNIDRGSYRVYLAPRAVAALLELIEGEMGEADLQQQTSALLPLRQGRQQLSPLLEVRENFQSGLVPRFNESGELAPPILPLIQGGKLVNSLVNSRSAQEYHCTSNGANNYESMRSPEICPGDLPPEEVLTKLDRGIYLSDLHYLNWSDRPTGRITGMTRYACFWVEGGKPIAPIPSMRFDDSLYNFLGENLEALTTTSELIPDTSTYDYRSIGGRLVPGMLVKEFTFTL